MTADRPTRPHPSVRTAIALGVAIVTLALCLRSGISSLSVLLPTVRDSLGFSPLWLSVLTTLPPLCFAVVGLGTGRLILRFGVHRVTVALLGALAIGLLARTVTDSWAVFLVATVLAMGGAAVGNVVLPPLAKQHFPTRLPLISALYGAALMGGATLASATTVPLTEAVGSPWRVGLAVWGGFAVVAMLLWLPTLRGRETTAGPVDTHRITLRQLAGTRLGWAFALCFSTQSAQAYVQFGWWGSILTEAGTDDAHAGLLLGVLTAVGIPVTLSLPLLIRLTHGSLVLPVVFAAATIAGWCGVLLAPLALGGVLWAVLLGAGGGAFTWVLAMLPQRTRTHDGTSQLSAFTQGIGYLGASAATFAAGILHEATGDWSAAIVMCIVLAVGIAVTGAVIARAGTVEDAVARR